MLTATGCWKGVGEDIGLGARPRVSYIHLASYKGFLNARILDFISRYSGGSSHPPSQKKCIDHSNLCALWLRHVACRPGDNALDPQDHGHEIVERDLEMAIVCDLIMSRRVAGLRVRTNISRLNKAEENGSTRGLASIHRPLSHVKPPRSFT